MIEIDFSEDLSMLGSRGDGIYGHIIGKFYVLVDCLTDLLYLLPLVLITSKVLLHSIALLQTKQMFAKHTNYQEVDFNNFRPPPNQ